MRGPGLMCRCLAVWARGPWLDPGDYDKCESAWSNKRVSEPADQRIPVATSGDARTAPCDPKRLRDSGLEVCLSCGVPAESARG
jgi:hypothetical protein